MIKARPLSIHVSSGHCFDDDDVVYVVQAWLPFHVHITWNAVCFLKKLPFEFFNEKLAWVWHILHNPASSSSSHPNTVVGIRHSTAYTWCNTEMSFSFTPLSQTLPYNNGRRTKRGEAEFCRNLNNSSVSFMHLNRSNDNASHKKRSITNMQDTDWAKMTQ